MKNSKQFKSKVASTIFAFLLIFTMILPPNQAYAEGDRVLRDGHCWLDGSKTCRKKRKGTECDNPKRCSAEAYLETGAKIVGIIVGVLTIEDKL